MQICALASKSELQISQSRVFVICDFLSILFLIYNFFNPIACKIQFSISFITLEDNSKKCQAKKCNIPRKKKIIRDRKSLFMVIYNKRGV